MYPDFSGAGMSLDPIRKFDSINFSSLKTKRTPKPFQLKPGQRRIRRRKKPFYSSVYNQFEQMFHKIKNL